MKREIYSNLFIFSFLFGIAFGLREDLVKEKACIPGPLEDPAVDLAWMGSVKRFYLPLWSKLYAYRVASDHYERDPSLISEFELPSGCLEFKKGDWVLAFGRELNYNISGDGSSITFKAPWHGAKSGKFEFHLSDSRSFILGITCWEDNQSTWAVLSPTKTITPEVRGTVLKYVKSLGFREDLIVDEPYSGCAGINCPLKPYFPNSVVPYPPFF